jgi:hypothetical protein
LESASILEALKHNAKIKYLIILIYSVMFIFFAYKMFFYSQYVGKFPDEICHVSYIATLEKDNAIIPDFKSMKILQLVQSTSNSTDNVVSGTYTFRQTYNYLGHPPLYYEIMLLSGGVTVNNDIVTVNLFQLRLFNMLLCALAMLLIFYIGFSRIGKSPLMHLLYATIVVSVPMLAYICAGINNDTLALIGVTVFIFGLIRFSEQKRNYLTYILISSGVTISFLSKFTTGAIISFAILFFLLFYLIRNKNLRFLISKQFLVTIPIYLVFIAYYVAVYLQIHSIQPNYATIDPKGFYASGFYVLPADRIYMSFAHYIKTFISNFLGTWVSIVSHVSLLKHSGLISFEKTALLSLCVLPLILFLSFKKNKPSNSLNSAVLSVYIGIAITVLIQILRAYFEYKNVSGYLGGYQSRYYLCGISAIALSIVFVARGYYDNTSIKHFKLPIGNNKINIPIKKTVTGCICVIFIGLLIYEDFIYFLLNFNKYLK